MEASLKKNIDFWKYVFLRFTIIFALHMQYTALTFSLFQLTQDNWTIGVMSLWEVIAALSFAFVAGQFVDRRPKVSVYLWTIISFTVLSIIVWYITRDDFFLVRDVDTVKYIVYAVMFFMGMSRAFGGPASFSLLSKLVKKENYNAAITTSTGAWQAGSVLGPLIGGLLLGYTHITVVETIVVICLVLAMLVVLSMKVEELDLVRSTESYMQSLREGFRFVFRKEIIWSVLSLDLFAVLFGGAQVLLPDFADNILQVGSIGYGWLKSATGIGSIIMVLLISAFPLKNNPGRKLLWSTAGFGVCIILFGLSQVFILSFFLLLFSGMFDAVSVIIRQSILQIYTPENMKGRVSSISSMFVNSSNELGGFESGVTAKWMGTIPAVVFGGSMTVLVVLIMDRLVPRIRDIHLEGEVDPEEEVSSRS